MSESEYKRDKIMEENDELREKVVMENKNKVHVEIKCVDVSVFLTCPFCGVVSLLFIIKPYDNLTCPCCERNFDAHIFVRATVGGE